MERRPVAGVTLADGTGSCTARAVVLTTGTFLRGVIHIGDDRRAGGRMGDAPRSASRSASTSFGLPLGRLKTGTPPRLDGRTIDWDGLEDAARRRRARAVLLPLHARPPRGRSPAASPTPTPAPTRSSARTSAAPPCTAAISKASARATARRSRTRSCASPTRRRTRSSSSPRGLTTTRSIRTASPPRCPPDVQEAYVRSIAGLENARDPPAGLRHRVRLRRSARPPPDAGTARGRRPLPRRPDQRHDRLRGGRRTGSRRRAQRRPQRPGPASTVCLPRATAISA